MFIKVVEQRGNKLEEHISNTIRYFLSKKPKQNNNKTTQQQTNI